MAAGSPPSTFLVVILDKGDASTEAATVARLLAQSGSSSSATVEALDIKTQEGAMSSPRVPLADAVMVWHTIAVDEALVARFERARVLVRVGVGYDNVDLGACARAGLPVCNVPSYGTEEVADHAMSLVLNLFRRTMWSAEKAARGEEARGSDGVAALARGTRRVRGSTLGILGCGRIGSATALRAKPFGLDVVIYDPYLPEGTEKALGVRRVATLQALAEASDVLSIHCDLNPTSRNIVDAALLAAMKPGSFVVNTARGGIIVEKDLRAALESGHIAGAGIDVHEVEPFLGTDDPATQPLAGAPNCICTPHTAFFSEQSFEEMRTLAGTSAAHALLGLPLVNCVNARRLLGEAGTRPRAAVAPLRE